MTNDQQKQQDYLLLDVLLYGNFLHEPNWEEVKNSLISSPSILKKNLLVKEIKKLISDFCEGVIKKTNPEKIGILLSGGIDSANILAELVRFNIPIYAYTWGGWGEDSTDVKYAKITAQRFGIKNHRIVLIDDNYSREELLYKGALKDLKIPLDYSNAIPFLRMREAILEDGVNVLFHGQNADTIFLAYSPPIKLYKFFYFASVC